MPATFVISIALMIVGAFVVFGSYFYQTTAHDLCEMGARAKVHRRAMNGTVIGYAVMVTGMVALAIIVPFVDSSSF